LIEHSVRDLLDVKGQNISESEKEKSRGKGNQKQGAAVADDVQTFFAHDGQGSMEGHCLYAPCSLWIRAKSIVSEGTGTVKVSLIQGVAQTCGLYRLTAAVAPVPQ
jgi:hypothetical protein